MKTNKRRNSPGETVGSELRRLVREWVSVGEAIFEYESMLRIFGEGADPDCSVGSLTPFDDR